MKFSTALLALAAVATAQPIVGHHAHHQHKREAGIETVFVQVTNYVDGNGNAVDANGNPVQVATQAPQAPSPTAQAEAKVTAAAAAPAKEQKQEGGAFAAWWSNMWEPASSASATAAASSAAPSPKPSPSQKQEQQSSSASSSSSKGSSQGVPQSDSSFPGGALGMVYSPYNSDGTCKDAGAVKSDLSKLSNYEVIRIYGTDCNQVPNVLAGIAPHQKVFAGVFDVNDVDNSLQAIADAVKAHGGWDVIHTVSIGNELVNNGAMTASAMNQITNSSRQKLRGLGYQGPVVSVDTFIAVINNPELCDASDYMAVNAHAFFDGHIKAEGAGQWAVEQTQRVWTACNGKKEVMIAESGWPSSGGTNGVAVPSKDNQQKAIASLKSSIGNDCILFTAFNDYWKSPGAFAAEQYWGIFE
ncbi:Cell surface mannoprotein MP65 [Yarrowia sp. C11]|nr:Cell surface mannoprotein MP65 [Yarrowia sp. E02]KAG5367534.1 Cell surface mannoprotein MP65 [Yarrowia sp. C11]